MSLSKIWQLLGRLTTLPYLALGNAEILAQWHNEHPLRTLARKAHSEGVVVELVVVPLVVEGVEVLGELWMLLLGVGERIENSPNGVSVSHRLKSFGPY